MSCSYYMNDYFKAKNFALLLKTTMPCKEYISQGMVKSEAQSEQQEHCRLPHAPSCCAFAADEKGAELTALPSPSKNSLNRALGQPKSCRVNCRGSMGLNDSCKRWSQIEPGCSGCGSLAINSSNTAFFSGDELVVSASITNAKGQIHPCGVCSLPTPLKPWVLTKLGS